MDLTPASIAVQAGALRLRCLVWGRDDDPTAMLVHGNGGHAHWWDPLVPALVPGWRLLAPDLRGHGESDWAEPPRYRIEDFAADLDAVLAALAPGRVALVGHSMGGRIAAWYAAQRPERTDGLALLDSRMEPIDRRVAAAWRARVAGQRHGRGYPTRAAALAAFRFVPDEPGVPPAVVADLAHHAVVERAPGDWTFRFDRAVLSLEGDGAGNLLEHLRHVRCPAIVLGGTASAVMDQDALRATARALGDAPVHLFPGGHHFLVAHASAVGRVLRGYLDGLLSRGGGR
jgi:pimeloyl-ACP methyl ester carboxylesterase